MTIAAGFNFDKGVLLCADTKHSGDMALYESKISTHEYASGAKSAIVFSGSTKYSRMTIRKIENSLSKLSQPSLDEMEKAIEKILLQVHKDHIFKHPDRTKWDGPSFWLLIGLWSPVDGLYAYSTAETAITPFFGYECTGSGEYLGHYIIKPRYHGRTGGLESVIFTALTALERIKRFDRDCGGSSDFVVLTTNGEIAEKSRFDIEKGEEFSGYFYQMVNLIYEDFALRGPDPSNEETRRGVVDRLMKIVLEKKQELERGKTRLEELVQSLSTQSSGRRLADLP
jgi:20S proteasome alpha/beta subunit